MAREKVKLDAGTARSIASQLVERLDDHRVAERDLIHGKDFNRRYDALLDLKAIDEKLRNLVGYGDAALKEGWDEAVAALRCWVLDNMRDDGWTRLLAARRKAKQQQNDRWHSSLHARKAQVLTSSMAAATFKELAESYGVERSVLLAKLADWLSYSAPGRSALQQFAADNQLTQILGK